MAIFPRVPKEDEKGFYLWTRLGAFPAAALIVGLGLLVGLAHDFDESAGRRHVAMTEPAFRFEDFGGDGGDLDRMRMEEHLARKLPAGIAVEEGIAYLEAAGARCGTAPRRSDAVVCTYRYRTLDRRFGRPFAEWTITLWSRNHSGALSRIETELR